MVKKNESTVEKFISSLSHEEKQDYDQGREAFILEEMLFAYLHQDYNAVKELAKMIGVPSSIITSNKVDADFFSKVLEISGYNISFKKNDHIEIKSLKKN